MTVTPEMLDAMIVAGLTREQIVAVTKASLLAEASATEAKRAAKRANNAERQRRWRERRSITQSNALSSVTERDPAPLNDAPASSGNVEVNLKTPPKEKDLKVPKEKPSKWPEGSFDRIWTAYPHKVGKKAAFSKLAVIERNGEATPEEILDGIERYKLAKPEHHDWANPLTWLNQGRWADEYGTPAATGPPLNGNHARAAFERRPSAQSVAIRRHEEALRQSRQDEHQPLLASLRN